MRALPIACLVLAGAVGAAFAQCPNTPFTDLGNALPGSAGTPVLTGSGSLAAACTGGLDLTGARPNSVAALIIGTQVLHAPFFGGTLVPNPDLVIAPVPVGPSGALSLSAQLPVDLQPGADLIFQYWIADPGGPAGMAASNAVKVTTATSIEPGAFPAQWIHGGPNCGSEPQIQVHPYNPDFYILRQSLCTNFEAPFMYLIFGDDKVLMLDTGAGGIPIYNTVKSIIDSWLLANGKPSIQLIVAHLHPHGDHVAGDTQFQGKPNVTLVGTSQTAVKNFFGIVTWPTQIVPYDLGGGRVVDVIPIPGHHSSHIAVYDRTTGILLTGDSLYPGRLYINGASSQGQWAVFKASMQRLVDFTANRPLAWVLGTHIEMTSTPFVDFPLGSTSHPNERELELTRAHLLELNNALIALGNTPKNEKHADFIIFPIN